MSLDEAKELELELQARCCAERPELASWSVCTTRPHLQYYHHVRRHVCGNDVKSGRGT